MTPRIFRHRESGELFAGKKTVVREGVLWLWSIDEDSKLEGFWRPDDLARDFEECEIVAKNELAGIVFTKAADKREQEDTIADLRHRLDAATRRGAEREALLGEVAKVIESLVLNEDEREAMMKNWDSWRAAIAKGDKGSWPRDAFESVIDNYNEELSSALAKLKDRAR